MVYLFQLRVLTSEMTGLTTLVTFVMALASFLQHLCMTLFWSRSGPLIFRMARIRNIVPFIWDPTIFRFQFNLDEIGGAWVWTRSVLSNALPKFHSSLALLIRAICLHSREMYLFPIRIIKRWVKQSELLLLIQIEWPTLCKFTKHTLRVKRCFSIPLLFAYFNLFTFSSKT